MRWSVKKTVPNCVRAWMPLLCPGEKLQDIFPFLIRIDLTQNGNAKKDKASRTHLSTSIPASHQACDAPAVPRVESLWGRDGDTGLLQTASPCPGQTQLQMHTAVALRLRSHRASCFAVSVPFLKPSTPGVSGFTPDRGLVWVFLLKNVGK